MDLDGDVDIDVGIEMLIEIGVEIHIDVETDVDVESIWTQSDSPKSLEELVIRQMRQSHLNFCSIISGTSRNRELRKRPRHCIENHP
jgi:hypothetical protein